MAKKSGIKALVGRDLKGFKVVEMTEVYRVNDDGHKTESVGFFKDRNIAVAFARAQKDAHWHKVDPATLLTDGTIGYVIEDQEAVTLFDDETATLTVKKKALEKLTREERVLLGLPEKID